MVTTAFAEKAAANACVVHGPLSSTDATAKTVDIVAARAGAGDVAFPNRDALVDELGLAAALEGAGLRLLRPGSPDWQARLPDAAVSVTSAFLGVAATGTLAITGGAGAPRALSLLPPVHV
jgi:L-lactate dehydrogenase complex protein LldG